MAKTTLPTNYVDDVLNGAMDGKRRYREIPNADGTISLEDATTYDQIGNNFGASQVNLMNDNINQSFDANKMLKTMDEVNAVTQEGYGVDALVVKELNNSLKFLPDYENAIKPFSENLSTSTTYTAPDNGIFLVYWWVDGTTSKDCYASINGNIVATTTTTGAIISQIIVSKGDVINFTISNAIIDKKSLFIPFK